MTVAAPHERSRHPRIDDAVIRAVVEGSPDGLLICDAAGDILYVNAALAEMTGYEPGELIGEQVEVLVPTALREIHQDHRSTYAAAPAIRPMGRGLELTAQRRDGSQLSVEISLSPVAGTGGTLTIASVRDVTDRLQDQERLRLADEQLTLSDERERIARDLHDTVLQRLFGLGLELQAAAMRAEPAVSDRLESAVDEIDRIIRDIRTTVFTLGAARRHGSLGQELSDVIAQAKRVLGFSPALRIDGPVESLVADDIRVELIASLREALGNVARHAHAREALVVLRCDDHVELRVADDGVGLPDGFQPGVGNGLRNLAARAARLGGTCAIENRPVGGAVLTWRVPITR
jgi:PAS domain S-box-containing protein